MRTVTRNLEFNLVVFALLLNFPWETLQAPLFVGMGEASYSIAIRGCLRATLGDAAIMLLAYWIISLAIRNRRWVLAPHAAHLIWFIALGVLITAVIEWLATHGHWIASWTYSAGMLVVPGVGIGLSPLLQWVIVPLLVMWFVRRQLSHESGDDGRQ